MTTALYQLVEDYRKLQEILDSEGGQEQFQVALGQLQGTILTKAENIGHLIKHLDHEAEMIDSAIDRLELRKKARQNASIRLREYLKDNLIACGELKLQFPLVSVSVQDVQPSVEVTDEKAIPSSFQKIITDIQINKLAILKYYKDTGRTPEGCRIITDRKKLVVR